MPTARDRLAVLKEVLNKGFETSLPQSKDHKDSSSRYEGTRSSVRVYKKHTPGEKKPK